MGLVGLLRPVGVKGEGDAARGVISSSRNDATDDMSDAVADPGTEGGGDTPSRPRASFLSSAAEVNEEEAEKNPDPTRLGKKGVWVPEARPGVWGTTGWRASREA